MTLAWLRGLLAHRRGRLLAAAAGVAVAVALLASLGSFLAASKATMTARATQQVAVDWQVQTAAGADVAAVLDTVRADPGTTTALSVGFADSTGFTATTGASTQRTGPGRVLGLPAAYRTTFPGEIRDLAGAGTGVLIAQQTAANLHVGPGDTVQVGRQGLAPAAVRIDGVVDLLAANSLFQRVGAPPQAQPAAPPDNVLLLPQPQFTAVTAPLAAAHPDLLSTQVHVARSHNLPPDPASAYTAAAGAARNLDVRLAGTGQVGDNLGATLDAARKDALYAQVLFLFLGTPGAVLAGLLTGSVVGAGAARRRREQSLLRTRGATTATLTRLAAVEAAAVAVAGAGLGLASAALIGRFVFGSAAFGATPATALWWAGIAVAAGAAVAAGTVLLPARRDARQATVVTGGAPVGRTRAPWWMRYGLDFVLLAGAGAVFWATSRSQYTLVLAPEGVPQLSVSYWAFAGPALLWAGAGLLTWRVTELALSRGHPLLSRVLRPFAGPLAGTVASTLQRQRRTLGRAVVLLALAVSFAVSTATFNTTYRAQAEVDARLTNGADVTVTESPGVSVGPQGAPALRAVPGVRSVEPIQHRFAYVGSDLQDLYGVRPGTITAATSLQDAYFQGGTAAGLIGELGRRPDGVLVSAETVRDFQLQPGDAITLRLQDGRTKQYTPVPFHYVGVVKEFPTAPSDSFLVANAGYVAARTGSDAVGAFLLDTGGTGQPEVADRLRDQLGTSATVTDITTSRAKIGSSLTAVDLSGLTRVELGFAVLLAAASGGLVLGLGLAERRRTFALAAALGAGRRHLRAFVSAEAGVVTVLGLTSGAIIGWVLSHLLVRVLTGVFDPPPAALAVPWGYLGATAGAVVVAVGAAVTGFAARLARRPAVEELREL